MDSDMTRAEKDVLMERVKAAAKFDDSRYAHPVTELERGACVVVGCGTLPRWAKKYQTLPRRRRLVIAAAMMMNAIEALDAMLEVNDG